MDFSFLQKLTGSQKADPKQVRRRQMRHRNISPKPFIAAFAAAVILLASLSVATVFSETDNEKETTPAVEAADAGTSGLAADAASQYINSNVLLMFTREDLTDPYLLAVLNISSEQAKMSLTYIPLDASVYVNNTHTSMKRHLTNGGINELLWAVREYTQVNVDKYICCNNKGFTDIMKLIGEYEVELESDVSHSYNGVDFIIEHGRQTLTADSMLKYFTYLCETYESKSGELTRLMAGIFSKLLNQSGQDGIAEKFNGFIDYITTNISVIDVAKYAAALDSLIDQGWPN